MILVCFIIFNMTLKDTSMDFALKYPLKCSEVCFEVQRSAYFAILGLHCKRTWVRMSLLSSLKKVPCDGRIFFIIIWFPNSV